MLYRLSSLALTKSTSYRWNTMASNSRRRSDASLTKKIRTSHIPSRINISFCRPPLQTRKSYSNWSLSRVYCLFGLAWTANAALVSMPYMLWPLLYTGPQQDQNFFRVKIVGQNSINRSAHFYGDQHNSCYDLAPQDCGLQAIFCEDISDVFPSLLSK